MRVKLTLLVLSGKFFKSTNKMVCVLIRASSIRFITTPGMMKLLNPVGTIHIWYEELFDFDCCALDTSEMASVLKAFMDIGRYHSGARLATS